MLHGREMLLRLPHRVGDAPSPCPEPSRATARATRSKPARLRRRARPSHDSLRRLGASVRGSRAKTGTRPFGARCRLSACTPLRRYHVDKFPGGKSGGILAGSCKTFCCPDAHVRSRESLRANAKQPNANGTPSHAKKLARAEQNREGPRPRDVRRRGPAQGAIKTDSYTGLLNNPLPRRVDASPGVAGLARHARRRLV